MLSDVPEGAIETWFNDDDGVIRDGFIMPDGAQYYIDKYGRITPKNLKSISNASPDFNLDYIIKNLGKEENNNINHKPAYNVPSIIFGIIILLGGLIFFMGALFLPIRSDTLYILWVSIIAILIGAALILNYKN